MRGQYRSHPCAVCGTPTTARDRCADCRGVHRVASLVSPTLPFERDIAARLFVEHFDAGAPVEAIAEALGITRGRVRQIYAVAAAKLRMTLAVEAAWEARS